MPDPPALGIPAYVPDAMDLVTTLPLATCRARLAASMDLPFALFGSHAVTGALIGRRLWAKKRIAGRNPCQTILRATLSEQEGGTRLRCRFGLSLFFLLFSIAWLSGCVLIGGPMFGLALAAVIARPAQLLGWAGPFLLPLPVMLGWFWGMVALGLHLARDEGRFLRDFLRRTLDARAE